MTTGDPSIQLLRRQMVRRLPRADEQAGCRPFALTARDQAILAAIATHGFLPADLIKLAFFAGPAADDPVHSRAQRRLRLLWLAGLLERIELPVGRVLGGRHPFVYALTPRGAACLPADRAELTGSTRRLDRKDDCLSDHDLWTATLWAQMQALTRAAGLQACRWTPERELRARALRVRDPLSGQWLPVLPDGYAELAYPDGRVQCCMVEIDMGTVSLHRFGQKLRALELYLAQGLFQRDFGQTGFEVLVLTHALDRLQHLRQVGRQVVPAAAWPWYSFALFADVAQRRHFGGDVWQTLGEDRTGLLYGPPQDEPAPALQLEQVAALGHSSHCVRQPRPTWASSPEPAAAADGASPSEPQGERCTRRGLPPAFLAPWPPAGAS